MKEIAGGRDVIIIIIVVFIDTSIAVVDPVSTTGGVESRGRGRERLMCMFILKREGRSMPHRGVGFRVVMVYVWLGVRRRGPREERLLL